MRKKPRLTLWVLSGIALASVPLIYLARDSGHKRLLPAAWIHSFTDEIGQNLKQCTDRSGCFPTRHPIPMMENGANHLLGTLIRDTPENKKYIEDGNWTRALAIESGSYASPPVSFGAGMRRKGHFLSESLDNTSLSATVAAALLGLQARTESPNEEKLMVLIDYDQFSFVDLPGGEASLFAGGRPRWSQSTNDALLKNGTSFLVVSGALGFNELEVSYQNYSRHANSIEIIAQPTQQQFGSFDVRDQKVDEFNYTFGRRFSTPTAVAIVLLRATVREVGIGYSIVLGPYEGSDEVFGRHHDTFADKLLKGIPLLPGKQDPEDSSVESSYTTVYIPPE